MRIHTDLFHLPIHRGPLAALCLAMALGILAVGLWPFNYLPRNRVSWITGENGIRFKGRGQVLVTRDVSWPAGDINGAGLTLELLLRPSRSYHHGVPHILTLCDDQGNEVFYLGQWKNQGILRVLERASNAERIIREIGTPQVLFPGKSILLTIVSGSRGTSIYADGKVMRELPGPDLAAVVSTGRVNSLVIGNSSFGDSPWQGDVLGIAVFDHTMPHEEVLLRYERWMRKAPALGTGRTNERVLYLFDQGTGNVVHDLSGNGWDLDIPKRLLPMRRDWLSWPSEGFLRKPSFIADAVINLLGFVPFGAVLTLFFVVRADKKCWHHPFVLPMAMGASLSLFIETNQAFLVSRDSSILDLFLNTAGAATGAFLGLHILQTIRKMGPEEPIA